MASQEQQKNTDPKPPPIFASEAEALRAWQNSSTKYQQQQQQVYIEKPWRKYHIPLINQNKNQWRD